MKFNDGYWMLKKGVSAYSCIDVRDLKIKEKSVLLYIAPFKVYNRGQTLSGPLFILELTSPQAGIISVKISHYETDMTPAYVYNDEKCPLKTDENDGILTVSSGSLSVEINKSNFKMIYKYNGKYLTSSAEKQLAYMKTPDGEYMRERLGVSVGENIYGLGERFTPFVKNGQVVDIWNEDGGTASEQAYKNIPFYISNKGYGIYVNHPENVSFEICSEAVSKAQFSVKSETLHYCVIGGRNLREVISNYTALTGRPALPPPWSFGLWLSTSFTTQYDEETVNSFIDGMFERGIPLSVFHFDCFWMKEYEWCNFTWDEEKFNAPEQMLARLKNKGLKICVWINPYIGRKSPLFDEAAQKGYLLKKLKNLKGGVWQWDMWQPGMGIIDFTNPDAAEWFKEHLRRLMSGGVDCFKTDFGERIPLDAKYYDGSDPVKMHNYYAYLYNKAVFEVTQESKGESVVFARSAAPGCQSFPVHWGGDCDSTYEAMAETLRGGLSLSLCGFGFWSHDISGFESTATPDLYKRWVAFGLLSSHSRLHGSSSYRVPWLFDDEASDVLRFFTKLKFSLMPYLFAQAVIAHKTGVPVMRPMVLEFQDDPVCAFLDRQYMLGENLLAAPVFNERGETSVYLPYEYKHEYDDDSENENRNFCHGIWTHWLTNKQIDSRGEYVEAVYDYFSLPLWVRPNSIIAVGQSGKDNLTVDYDYEDSPTLHVFSLDKAQTTIYGKDGQEHFTVKLEMIKFRNKMILSVEGKHNGFSILFRNLFKMHIEQSFPCRRTDLGFEINIPSGCESAEIYIN